MKKIIAGIISIAISVCAYAQKDVTKFLGIPVDGTKSEIIEKLKAKGFIHYPELSDLMSGTFNGREVYLSITTNGDKVHQILVIDAMQVDEGSIINLFNNLCQQFENNPNYLPDPENKRIPDDENIRFEIRINHKFYQATFFQNAASDPTFLERMSSMISDDATTFTEMMDELMANEDFKNTCAYLTERTIKKPVRVFITENYGNYILSIAYENAYNRANGEDL